MFSYIWEAQHEHIFHPITYDTVTTADSQQRSSLKYSAEENMFITFSFITISCQVAFNGVDNFYIVRTIYLVHRFLWYGKFCKRDFYLRL